MNSESKGDPLASLLVLSAIDLLIAALCAAVGVMVVFMISTGSGTSRQASPASSPSDDGWILFLAAGRNSRLILSCADQEPILRTDDGPRAEYVLMGSTVASCELEWPLVPEPPSIVFRSNGDRFEIDHLAEDCSRRIEKLKLGIPSSTLSCKSRLLILPKGVNQEA